MFELVSFTDNFADDGVADTHTFLWTVTGPGESFPSTDGPNFSFTPKGSGAYSVQFDVLDDDGGSDSQTVNFNVANVAPFVFDIEDIFANEGDTVNLAGFFTDPGVLDMHTFEWVVFPFPANGQVVPNGTEPAYSFQVEQEGAYFVTFTVDDAPGVRLACHRSALRGLPRSQMQRYPASFGAAVWRVVLLGDLSSHFPQTLT